MLRVRSLDSGEVTLSGSLSAPSLNVAANGTLKLSNPDSFNSSGTIVNVSGAINVHGTVKFRGATMFCKTINITALGRVSGFKMGYPEGTYGFRMLTFDLFSYWF